MSSKQANNNPGLCPVKGQKFGLFNRTRGRNKFSSLSVGTCKTVPRSQMLVSYRALYRSFIFRLETPRDGPGPADF